MAATATAKQNTTKRGYSYYGSIPRCLCTSSAGFTISTRFIGGLIASFSGKEDENGNKSTFSGTRKMIKDLIGCSPATISRSLSKLKGADFVTRKGMSTYEFDHDKLENEKKWSFPLEITTRIFKMTDDDGNVINRALTPGAISVYSYFYTKLSSKSRKLKLEVTYKEVADELGIDSSTVSPSVDMLRYAKLVYFPKGWVGVNRYKKSKIGLTRHWSWFRAENEYRKRKEKATKKVSSSAKQPENAPITRDFYYSELQAIAAQKVDEVRQIALSHEDYKVLNEEINGLNAQYRKAIIYDNEKAQELSARIEELRAQSLTVLENIGLSERQLMPEFYAKCKKCKDTGWRSDGKACGCFRQRGAPPDERTKNTVGELNTKN